jgi:hypothetical protein
MKEGKQPAAGTKTSSEVQGLPGYEAYEHKVCCRLFPGFWREWFVLWKRRVHPTGRPDGVTFILGDNYDTCGMFVGGLTDLYDGRVPGDCLPLKFIFFVLDPFLIFHRTTSF